MKSLIVLLSSLLLTTPLQAVEPYSCGPFLLQPGTDRICVVVDHEKPVSATLRYGPVGGKETNRIDHEKPARHHCFALEGLKPGTEYWYEIRSGRKLRSRKRTFRTLPERPDAYRLIALGDVRSQPEIWHRIAQRILEEEGDVLFLIGTGDYPADGRQYGQWIDQFFAPARDLLGRIPIWPAVGNHERPGRAGEPREKKSRYFSLFDLPGNERWYRVDYQYLTLLVLDSNSPLTPDSDQYEWLRSQLRSGRERFTVAAFHHDPVCSGPHDRLNPDGTPRERAIDQLRRFAMPLFEMYGVDLVLNGHDHLYERSLKDGVFYVVTGGGGAPLYEIDRVENKYQQAVASVHHYVRLDVDREAIRLTAIDLDGEIIDWVKIPVSAASLERERRFIGEKLDQQIEIGAYDPENHSVLCAITNPFDLPLHLSLTVGTEGGTEGGGLQEETFDLAPKARKEVRLDLRKVLPTDGSPAWKDWLRTEVVLVAENEEEIGRVEIRHPIVLKEPVYRVKRLPSPQVDGDPEEWKGLPAMVLDSQLPVILNRAQYQGEEDLQAWVRLGWSPDSLYLCVEVQDDVVVDDGEGPVWDNDSVELYFDGRPETARTDQYGQWVSQNIVPVLRKAEEKFAGTGGWSTEAIEWKVRQREGGYVLEAGIPFRLLTGKERLQAGDRLRFDLMINDRDSGENDLSHLRLWSRGKAYQDPSEFGLLILEE